MNTKSPIYTFQSLAALFSVVWFFSLTGCGGKTIDDRLVGKWHEETTGKSDTVFEFKSDGTYTVSYGWSDEGKDLQVNPGTWWVLRRTEDGVIVRFDKDHRAPTDRLIEFFDNRVDFREKDGGFLVSYVPFEDLNSSNSSKSDKAVDADDDSGDDKAQDDSEKSASDDDIPSSNPLDGVNFEGTGKLPRKGD